MSNEIGKLIKDGFKTIESARKAAQDLPGFEAILKKADGTYALHEIDIEHQMHDNLIRSLNDKSKGRSNEVVELYLDYLPEKVYRVEKNDQDPDSIGIGEKISDRYIDDFKENKFQNIDDADKASGSHKGIEAIVRNQDGSYSLYSVSLKDVEKILSDPEKYPGIERINFPYTFYGASVEASYDAINVHEKDSKGNFVNNFENFKDRIDHKADYSTVIRDMALTPDRLKLEKTDDYKDLENSSSTSVAAKISTLKGMEKASQVIKDLNSGKYVSIDGLKTLETSLTDIISQAATGNIKLDETDLSSLKSMKDTVTRLKDTESQMIKVRQEFNAAAAEAEAQVFAIDKKIKELEKETFLNEKETNALNTLRVILGNYARVANSGDRENIALYAIFMKHALSTAGSSNDPLEVKRMMGKYNTVAGILSEFKEYGSLTPDGRDLFFNHLRLMNASPEEVKLFENYFNTHLANAIDNPANFNFIDQSDKPADKVNRQQGNAAEASIPIVDVGFAAKSDIDLKGLSKVGPGIRGPQKMEEHLEVIYGPSVGTVKKYEPLPVFTDEQLKTAGEAEFTPKIMTPLLPEIQKTVQKLEKVVDTAFKVSELEVKQVENLKEFFERSKFAENILKSLMEAIKEDLKDLRKSEKEMDKVINKLIKNADELQEKLDLGVDPGAASISELMHKFREIIEELDLSTRELIFKKLSAKILDESFTRYLKENRERSDNLEVTKQMLDKAFKESTEVKESSMSFELKQIKFNDISLKIALMSLYGV
jgi:hypothetical protein